MSIQLLIKDFFAEIMVAAQDRNHYSDMYANVSRVKLAITFIVALGVLICAWILFEYLAQHSRARYVYRQRLFHPLCIGASNNGPTYRSKPPDAYYAKSVLFGTYMLPESELGRLMGPGGYLSYRIMRHCMYFSFVWLFYSMVVVVPVLFCQGSFDEYFSKILDNIIITKISEGNPSHIWVFVISSYLMCGYWVIVLYSEWQIVKKTRISFEHNIVYEHLQSTYSLLVQTPPDQSSTDFASVLSKLLGPSASQILLITQIKDTSRLRRLRFLRGWNGFLGLLYNNRKKLEELDKDIEFEIEETRKLVQQDILSPSPVYPMEHDRYSEGTSALISTNTREFPDSSIGSTTVRTTSALLRNISRLFIAYRLPTYFVTFSTMRARTLMAQMYLAQLRANSDDARGCNFPLMVPAPTPADVIWSNVTVDAGVSDVRKLLVRVFLIIAAAAFAYPIVLVQDEVRRFYKEGDEDGVTWMREMVVLYTAPLLQVALWHIIPAVLRVISKRYERYKTYQDVARYVIHRSFIFQLLTIYVIVFGGLWPGLTVGRSGAELFLESIAIRFRLLGSIIPPLGHYFSSMIIIGILTETAYNMINPFTLLAVAWNSYARHDPKPWINVGMMQYRYSTSFTFILAILNVMFTFCLICPFVVVIGCVFWTLNSLWSKYALIYLNNRKYEVGSAFSSTTFSAIAMSLIISQMALLMVLWSMNSSKWTGSISYQVSFVAIVVFLLIIFKYIVMSNFKDHPNDSLTLGVAVDIDRDPNNSGKSQSFQRDYYYQPGVRDTSTTGSTVAQYSVDDIAEHHDYLHPTETSRLINGSLS